MRFKIKGRDEVFTDIDEAMEFVSETDGLTENDIQPYSLFDAEDEEEIKYKSRYCDENPDDPRCKEHKKKIHGEEYEPDEDSVIPEGSPEWRKIKYEEAGLSEREAMGMVALEDYDQIEDKTDRKMILSKALGASTGKQHNKDFNKPVKTGEAFEKAYGNVIERLQDPHLNQCPFCGVDISQDRIFEGFSQDIINKLRKENLAVETKNEFAVGGKAWSSKMIKSPRQQLKGVPVPKIIETHIQIKHKNLFNELEKVFNQFEEVPDSDGVGTYLKPSDPSNVENLSKEELAEKINSDPELRKQFFRRWLKTLQDRE